MPLKKMNDPYFKLKPIIPTPEDELCKCSSLNEIYVAFKLGSNPLHCLKCNREIAPEKVGFQDKLSEEIASWNSTYGSLYMLWLDSGEYESWAKERILDQNGQVNQIGFELVKELSKFVKTYYLWFRESYEDESPSNCPICSQELKEKEECNFLVCEHCKIII
jgi:predicted  nucleic acid-binding Zn ribbon protein